MNVLECINERRSVRRFTDKAVPPEVIDELISLGTKAATGSGNQPWGFVVITDLQELKRISDEAKRHWLANMEKYPYMQQYKNWLEDKNFNIFYNAPCLLIIYGNTESHWYVYDSTLSAGNIMLASREYGLGTCWVGFAEHICDSDLFKSKYNIPAKYKLVCPLIIGYPETELPPPKRKPALIFTAMS